MFYMCPRLLDVKISSFSHNVSHQLHLLCIATLPPPPSSPFRTPIELSLVDSLVLSTPLLVAVIPKPKQCIHDCRALNTQVETPIFPLGRPGLQNLNIADSLHSISTRSPPPPTFNHRSAQRQSRDRGFGLCIRPDVLGRDSSFSPFSPSLPASFRSPAGGEMTGDSSLLQHFPQCTARPPGFAIILVRREVSRSALISESSWRQSSLTFLGTQSTSTH